jgi:hypothetical protein
MSQRHPYNILLYSLMLIIIVLWGPATNGYASGGKECGPDGCIGSPLGPAIRATLTVILEENDDAITIMISNGICENVEVEDFMLDSTLTSLFLEASDFEDATAQGLNRFVFELPNDVSGPLADTACFPQKLSRGSGGGTISLQVHGVHNFSNDGMMITADVVLLFFVEPID